MGKRVKATDLVFFERTPDGMITHSISSKLFEKRIIFVKGVIEPEMANEIVGALLLFNFYDANTPIEMFIHSPGGYVESMMAIYDTMQHISAPCHTTAIGQVASAASLLLAAGEKGHRSALPNASIMIHQPSSGMQGQTSDIQIEVNELLRLREKLNQMLSDHTGQPLDVIERDTDRNFYMNPTEALAYGIIDEIK